MSQLRSIGIFQAAGPTRTNAYSINSLNLSILTSTGRQRKNGIPANSPSVSQLLTETYKISLITMIRIRIIRFEIVCIPSCGHMERRRSENRKERLCGVESRSDTYSGKAFFQNLSLIQISKQCFWSLSDQALRSFLSSYPRSILSKTFPSLLSPDHPHPA